MQSETRPSGQHLTTHSHHRRRESRLLQVLREFRFEIIVGLIVVIGVFLVLEELSIRVIILGWLDKALGILTNSPGRVASSFASFISRTTLSDLVGGLLIIVAFVAVLLRVRWRLTRSESFTGTACPRCGTHLQRVHRRSLDHLVSWFVPVRRYRCANGECRWRGLRVVAAQPGHHSERRPE